MAFGDLLDRISILFDSGALTPSLFDEDLWKGGARCSSKSSIAVSRKAFGGDGLPGGKLKLHLSFFGVMKDFHRPVFGVPFACLYHEFILLT